MFGQPGHDLSGQQGIREARLATSSGQPTARQEAHSCCTQLTPVLRHDTSALNQAASHPATSSTLET